METLLAEVYAELERRSMSEAAVSRAAVGNPSALKNLRIRLQDRGDAQRNHPISNLKLIADYLGLDFYIGPPRDTGPAITTEIDGADFATVPRYDVALAAGSGVLNDETPPVGAIAFRRDWLAREGIRPGEAMVVSVKGDSMAPTLCDGDLVLVDKRLKTPVNRRIYALIGPEGEARIKRVERLPVGLLLLSDNDATPSELIPAADANHVSILGEVIWWGHTVRA